LKAGQLWKDAQSAFSAGNYTQAASSLESIIKASGASVEWGNNAVLPPALPKKQWLEPVFFLLGATYFDAKDWPNAIGVFAHYQQLFPKSSHLNQVIFSQAQADLFGGHPEDSMPLLTELLPLPDYHVKVFLLLVEANFRANRPDAAVALMEKEKSQPNLNPNFVYKINIVLFPKYLDAGNTQKALALLQEMDEGIGHVADVPLFNALSEKLGDLFLKNNDIASALSCYRRVRDNEQILTLQKQQIENLRQQRAANMALIQANPLNSDSVQTENKEIDAEIAKDQDILTKYQTLPPVLPPLFLRIARAYSLNGSLWEAAVVYHEILRRYPQCAEAEAGLYGSIVIFDQLKRVDRAQRLCQTYLAQYPNGKYADSVGFLRGALAYDAQDFAKATEYFEDSLKNQPGNPRREQIEITLGDIELQEGKFDEAIASYQKYQSDYPQGQSLEKAQYRSALALLFGGKTNDAEAAIKAYLQKYPQGAYAGDGDYRLSVIKFGEKQYDQVLADGLAWQQKYGKAVALAEVLSLMGDSYEAENRHDEAVTAYISSYKAALTTEVLNYSIMAAAKILQKQDKWADIAAMFQEFIKNNPDHPTVVAAIFWIGRADIKLGKVDEGKQFMAETAKKYLNDPSREAVDEIITQLAQLYAHRKVAAAAPTSVPLPAPTVGPASTPSPAPEVAANPPPVPAPAESDPAQDLTDILTIPDLASKPTARSRVLYAKAELARLQRKPEVEAQVLLEVAKDYKPEDLSPILLGQVGDCLFQNGQPDQAMPFYNQLMDAYEKSPLVEYAYNGLAQIAFGQKDYKKADRYFSQALDKGIAASKLEAITLGEAQNLLALNRLDEAKALFEQVASNRAWRGEATALSVYSLGEIQMGLGKFPEANAYYQRVFVAYQKYPDIQAKAYLRSGEAFEKMGKTTEARNTYSEMLRNPALASFPETSDAKKHLDHLTQ